MWSSPHWLSLDCISSNFRGINQTFRAHRALVKEIKTALERQDCINRFWRGFVEIRPKQTLRPALPFPLVASPPSAPLQGTPFPDGSWPPSRPFLTPSLSDGFNCRRPAQGPSACTLVASLRFFTRILSRACSASCWTCLSAPCPTSP